MIIFNFAYSIRYVVSLFFGLQQLDNVYDSREKQNKVEIRNEDTKETFYSFVCSTRPLAISAEKMKRFIVQAVVIFLRDLTTDIRPNEQKCKFIYFISSFRNLTKSANKLIMIEKRLFSVLPRAIVFQRRSEWAKENKVIVIFTCNDATSRDHLIALLQ